MTRLLASLGSLTLALAALAGSSETVTTAPETEDPSLIAVGQLVYGNDQSAVCFSDEFTKAIEEDTYVRTTRRLDSVHLDSSELFQYPFVVMTGENSFQLTEEQRTNLRDYVTRGGFLVASAGCSSTKWADSFRSEFASMFPEKTLEPIPMDHAIYSTVHPVERLTGKKRSYVSPTLYGLTIDGKIVIVFSEDGLNDTANVGGDCCCCGGNELANARDINVNLLAYALTH